MSLKRPLERLSVRRAGAVALALLILVLAAQTWHKAHRPDGNDLTSYLSASAALVQGSSPYEAVTPFPYIYPLFPALALIPLTVLPYGAVVLLWFGLSVAALGWSLALFARRETPDGRLTDAVPIAAIVLFLLIDVVQNNLLNGQINFVVLACCAAALAASRAAAAAVWWAVAISTKLVPLALAPWWILRNRISVVCGATVIALLLMLVPLTLTDSDIVLRYVDGFVGGSLASGAPEDDLRFSLYGVLGPTAHAVPWLPLVCAVLVIAAAALVDGRRGRDADDHVAFALYLAAIPLASPKSETHHLAFAIPAAYICALRILRSQIHPGDWRRRVIIASVAGFWLGSLLGPVRNWCWFGALVLLCGVTAGLMITEVTEATENDKHGPCLR
jgi:alpha-1,2-mannosyltransferase